jgi:hypothetical protein
MESRSFLTFVVKDRRNRYFFWAAVACISVEWFLFKIAYPFPDFFSDSYSYLFAAKAGLDINIWPIGYSKFLNLFHHFFPSGYLLVTFQFFLLEVSAWYFHRTIRDCFKLRSLAARVLFIFLLFNPVSLYLSNYVNSDAVFAAFSLLWLSEVINIIFRPRLRHLITQALLLFLAFSIRNNAYYYPVISILAFFLSPGRSIWYKLSGSIAGLALIGIFVLHTMDAAYELTGTRQFSLFTGWQMANNSLYMYDKIKVNQIELPGPKSVLIDNYVRHFFGTLKYRDEFDDYLPTHPGNFFIQYNKSPIKRYFFSVYPFQNEADEVAAWGKASADLEQYGKALILSHPISFTRYFVLPNAVNYLYPPLEKLEVYNLGSDSIEPAAAQWFGYDDLRVTSVSKDVQGLILTPFPWLFLLLNLVLLGGLSYYLGNRKFRQELKVFNNGLLLLVSFWLLNLLFSLVATIVVFRYEFVPMILLMVTDLALLDRLDHPITPSTLTN